MANMNDPVLPFDSTGFPPILTIIRHHSGFPLDRLRNNSRLISHCKVLSFQEIPIFIHREKYEGSEMENISIFV